MKTKILIIKLGYSETLDSEIGRVPSLGDVIRTTPVLWALKEKYPDSHITWLVSREAEPLLNGNNFIERVLIWDEFVPFQLMREKYDVLINLEKISGVCALSDMIDAWVKYGFRFESINGIYHGYEKGLGFIDYIEEKRRTNKPKDIWQKVLIEMLGVAWKGQNYILGYKPNTRETSDIGLNFRVGSKWPTKAMPESKWKKLNKQLTAAGYKVSMQEGLHDLYAYIDWINSNRIIITHDSLGLHLALALKKKIVGLFGPTDPTEISLYGDVTIISPPLEKCQLMPCYCGTCSVGLNCMNTIGLDEIINSVEAIGKHVT